MGMGSALERWTRDMCCRGKAAVRAKASGSTRFCMGAAWRGPSQVGQGQWQRVLEMVSRIRALDMEVCPYKKTATLNLSVTKAGGSKG